MEVRVPQAHEGSWFSWSSVNPPLNMEIAIDRLYSPYGAFFWDLDVLSVILSEYPLWTNTYPVPYTPRDLDLRVQEPFYMSPKPVAKPYWFIGDAGSQGAYEILRTGLSVKEILKRGARLEGAHHENDLERTNVQGVSLCVPMEVGDSVSLSETEVDSYGYPHLVDVANTGYTSYSFERNVRNGYTVTGNPGCGEGVSTQFASTWRLIQLLKDLEGTDITYPDKPSFKVHYIYVNVQGDGLGFVINYQYRITNDTYNHTTGVTCTRRTVFRVIAPVAPAYLGTGLADISTSVEREQYGDWASVGWTPSKVSLNTEAEQSYGLVSMYHAFGHRPRLGLIQRWNQPVTDWLPLKTVGRAGPYFAVADAIHKHFQFFDTNWVEGLSELRDIAQVVPDFRKLLKGMKYLPGGNYLNAGIVLLDFFTGAKLAYDFGFRPTSDAALEFLTKFDDLYRHITSTLGSTIILHGSARGTTSVGYDHLYVESHAKLEAVFPHTALMAAVLGLDGSGLLPRLSRLWETVPFSFVIDWIFNVGGRIEVHEDAAFVLLLEILSYVTSTKVTSPLRADELSAAGLSPVTNCTVVRYNRHVSVFPPHLHDDQIDYLSGGRYPSVFTAGSLAYQVFKPR